MEMSEKGIHRLLILLQLMVVLGHVQHLIGVDNVEVGHEQHLGEEDGVVAGLLGLVDHAGGVQDFLVQGKDQRVVAGFCLQVQHQEERTQPPEREYWYQESRFPLQTEISTLKEWRI